MTQTLFSTQIGDDGDPVVFLHGLFGQGKNFTRVARALQPQYRSLLIDLPNHGRSPWTQSFSYPDMADRVAAHLRERLGDDPIHLVGHSMGGKVAMVLALRHPGLVNKMVVGDISPADTGGVGNFDHLLTALETVDLQAITRRSDADQQLVEWIPNASVRGFLLQNLQQIDGRWAWQANLEMLHEQLGAIADFPQFGDQTFRGPVLWLAGDRSDYVQTDHHDVMRKLFPRTVLVTLKDAGHWIHSEKPDEFISIIRTFLKVG